ncbi:hypothetical protein BKA62DRAFT_9648 [Auriculariales sp. MPI-PUGE-AT-0066]|nr:hypothetical protein BKA62DRAFT_9648 [Auriculariales sp. MPI-PUGE-AT-0066]
MATFFRGAAGSSSSGTVRAGERRPGGVTTTSTSTSGSGSGVRLAAGGSDAKQARRISRTDEEFERALQTSETKMLHEGFDEAALGTQQRDARVPVVRRSSQGTTTTTTTTTTTSTRTTGGPPNGSDIPPFDLDDIDLQTKRRSIFRSPGTASSPDLATLVRKARDRGGIVKENPREDELGILTSGAVEATLRPRAPSSVSSNYSLVAPPSPPPKPRDIPSSISQTSSTTSDRRDPIPSDWQNSGPRPRTVSSKEGYKSVKATMKSKTSGFLTRMWGGQGSVREKPRSNTISNGSAAPPSSYNAPPLPAAFSAASSRSNAPPPVPPVPAHYRSSSRDTSAASSSADIFQSAESSPALSNKPLPPVQDRPSRSSSGHDEAETPPDSATARTRAVEVTRRISERENRRKSTSLGAVDWRDIIAESASPVAPSSHEWEKTMQNFVGDFKLELDTSHNDIGSPTDVEIGHTPVVGSLPSPYRRDTSPSPSLPSVVLTESLSIESVPTTANSLKQNGGFPDSPSSSAAHLCESPSSEAHALSHRPSSIRISPSRTSTALQRSSLTAVPTPTARTSSVRPARPASTATFPSAGLSYSYGPSASPDASRLLVQHHSMASASEPSLINPQPQALINGPSSSATPTRSASGARTIRLVSSPSTPSSVLSQSRPQRRGSDHEHPDAKGSELATRCWNEDEAFLAREKIAEFLGGSSALSARARFHYMKYYDFSKLRLDQAFRRLCAKLYLKAETQQVDRILEVFSQRYFECNPQSIFGSAGVVHAVSYSLLLLNTDLHIAEISTRMSKSQFVRNTMAVVIPQRKQTIAEMDSSAVTSPAELLVDESASSRGSDTGEGGATLRKHSKRSGSIQSWKSISRDILPGNNNDSSSSLHTVEGRPLPPVETPNSNTSAPLMHTSFHQWMIEVESMLKDMYSAVKNNQILQPVINGASPTMSLSPGSSQRMLLRNGSQRGQQDRAKPRNRTSVLGIQALWGQPEQHGNAYSSHSSLERPNSPADSSMIDINSISYPASSAQTIGFASSLSRTIIRETPEGDSHSVVSRHSTDSSVSITDEELALHGAPWAKEGRLSCKLYWESTGKRAKNKLWAEVFAVVSKGELKMFTFGEGGTSGAHVVGGGNWMTSASSAGDVPLAHSLAHVLPAPGYNRQRPHCFVLTIATGAVYFFQAGTEDLVNEWVSTCNYWAARQSKEPLAGGVSNMEYGWNRVSDDGRFSTSPSTEDFHGQDPADTFSIRSGRSRMSKRSFVDAAATMRIKQSPRDRIYINDWKAPIPSTVASAHDEETQLEAMQKQLDIVQGEREAHNAIQRAMIGLYTPRSSNLSKANANWDRKSEYLKSEVVKYSTYVESLRTAMAMRLKKRGEKALERALSGTVTSDHRGTEEESYGDDLQTPVLSQNRHRREVAEDEDEE